jgi:ferritin-like metal-binding protein YciE
LPLLRVCEPDQDFIRSDRETSDANTAGVINRVADRARGAADYKSLLALCGPAGVEQARAPLQMSLEEEQRMAQWIDANVEKVTMQYIARQRQAA